MDRVVGVEVSEDRRRRDGCVFGGLLVAVIGGVAGGFDVGGVDSETDRRDRPRCSGSSVVGFGLGHEGEIVAVVVDVDVGVPSGGGERGSVDIRQRVPGEVRGGCVEVAGGGFHDRRFGSGRKLDELEGRFEVLAAGFVGRDKKLDVVARGGTE